MRILIAALIALAFPATAQELSDRYQVIGQMEVTLDGTEMVLPIAVDLEETKSFANIIARPSIRMLAVTGVTAADHGGWERPLIALAVRISGAGGGSLMSIDLIEKGRNHPKYTQASFLDAFGSMDLPEFSITEDGAIDLQFSGELVRVVWANNEYTPEEGQPPVVISGTASMVIPEAYRVP
jgi:hypothetical protein